ncbi:MAG TPA: HD domain-containing protein [Thermoanaerobaculia bacterium]|nr:HD domain-containing protein [Thermoanaerobaculia bacterium]HUM28699.1 HD domain-containing protein [Thermoanaerobaculia bacterium]HXK68052.1 HD domain-containing protein [Thermoanaerobaculia bacterium]
MPSNRFVQVLEWAVRLHGKQKRKGTEIPYIAHLLGVASIAMEFGADEEEAMAALLHDAVEDQGGSETREAIRRTFGDRVTRIVIGCTDSEETPRPPWKTRKEAYLARVSTFDRSILLVSLADKIYNLRTIIRLYRDQGDSLLKKLKGGKEGRRWYYNALVGVFGDNPETPGELLKEFTRTVQEFNDLAKG